MTESKHADVYAFGILVWEILTGKIPFEDLGDKAAILYILQGGRPVKPKNFQDVGLTAGMWELLEECWQQSPKKRPTMKEVVKKWKRFIESENELNTFPEYVHSTIWLAFNPILNYP